RMRGRGGGCQTGWVDGRQVGSLRGRACRCWGRLPDEAEVGEYRPRDALARVRGAGSVLAAGLETARLHPVAAHLHVAPTARVIFARVEEEPAAGVYSAGFYAR